MVSHSLKSGFSDFTSLGHWAEIGWLKSDLRGVRPAERYGVAFLEMVFRIEKPVHHDQVRIDVLNLVWATFHLCGSTEICVLIECDDGEA
jgi:hypothetical protein